MCLFICRCKNPDDNMYDSVLGFQYWDNTFVSVCRPTYDGQGYEMDGWRGATATCKTDPGCTVAKLKSDNPWIASKGIRLASRTELGWGHWLYF